MFYLQKAFLYLTMEEKKIRNFYKNKNILITGGTGFIGQLLVDKLLRSCDGINQIYLLVRDKKGKTAAERVDEYFNKEVSTLERYEHTSVVPSSKRK